MGMFSQGRAKQSGTYVPVVVPNAGVDTIDVAFAWWFIVGGSVTVTVPFALRPSSAVLSDFAVSCPEDYRRSFQADPDELSGIADFGNEGTGRIVGLNNAARFLINTGSIDLQAGSGTFSYMLVA